MRLAFFSLVAFHNKTNT